MSCKSGDGTITPSEVSQKHISERIGGSYPIAKAMEVLEEAQKLGFGTLQDSVTPNKRVVKQFRKRPFEELSVDCREQLKRARITQGEYSRAFSEPVSTNRCSLLKEMTCI